jgi:hypothetical protein
MTSSRKNREFCLDDFSDFSSSLSEFEDVDTNESEENMFSFENEASHLTPDGLLRDLKDTIEINESVKKDNIKIELKELLASPGVKILPKFSNNVKEVVRLFIGDDFFDYITIESNRYRNKVL